MQTQFQYIIELAKLYKTYSDHPEVLYKAINELSDNIIDDIFKEYGDPESKFQPVNVLRAEVARLLLGGKQITEELVEEIKEKIRTKDLKYFDHSDKSFLEELKFIRLVNVICLLIGKISYIEQLLGTQQPRSNYFTKGVSLFAGNPRISLTA